MAVTLAVSAPTPLLPFPQRQLQWPGRMYCQQPPGWRTGAEGLFTMSPAYRWRGDHGIDMAAAPRTPGRAAKSRDARHSCSPPPSAWGCRKANTMFANEDPRCQASGVVLNDQVPRMGRGRPGRGATGDVG